MRRVKLVLAVAVAVVVTMALAGGPAFAGTDGICTQMPLSPMAGGTVPPTPSALLLQLAVVVGVAVVAALALAPSSPSEYLRRQVLHKRFVTTD